MIKRTQLAKQFAHRCEEMGNACKLWSGASPTERAFVISFKQHTRFGVQDMHETCSLRRAINFCAKHGLTLPEPAHV